MDHTSELESMAAQHQHVNSEEEQDMLLKELDLKELSRGFFRKSKLLDGILEVVFAVLVYAVLVYVVRVPQLRSNCSKRGHLSSSSHTGDVSLKGSDHHNKKRASMQKRSSWITALTFPGVLLLTNYRPYPSLLCNEQRSFFSIWLPLLGMLNFTAFLSSIFSMVICGAHFTQLHVISALLLSSFFHIAAINSLNCN